MARSKTEHKSPGGGRDLSNGVIVVLSGGPFDFFNPADVLQSMERLISDVNADAIVHENTGGQGLKFKLLGDDDQPDSHIHQHLWPQICAKLKSLKQPPSPLILIGHSNGGAAVIDLARCLQEEQIAVDLAFTVDSVLTLNDNGNVNQVPSNVRLNLNPYVIPVFPDYLFPPFPIGTKNHRESDGSLDGILNIGLPFPKGGAIAHHDAFYDLAGGDQVVGGPYTYPRLILETTLAVLHGDSSNDEIFQMAQRNLQVLSNEVRVAIELETTNFKTTLEPAGMPRRAGAQHLTPASLERLQELMKAVQYEVLTECARHVSQSKES